MTNDYLTRVAEAVRDAAGIECMKRHDIASVPRPETVAAQVAVPHGWKLVPVEPTAEMKAEAWKANASFSGEWAHRAYRAMLAAAPEAPQTAAQWWLAELDQYGNPTLIDGAHGQRTGVDQAFYLHSALGLAGSRKYAVARVELSEPVADGSNVNHDAVGTLHSDIKAMVAMLQAREWAEHVSSNPVVTNLEVQVTELVGTTTTLRKQNAALEQDAARYHALRAELIRADGPIDERGEIEKAIKEVMRKAYAERGDPMPTAAEFDTAIDISIASAKGGA